MYDWIHGSGHFHKRPRLFWHNDTGVNCLCRWRKHRWIFWWGERPFRWWLVAGWAAPCRHDTWLSSGYWTRSQIQREPPLNLRSVDDTDPFIRFLALYTVASPLPSDTSKTYHGCAGVMEWTTYHSIILNREEDFSQSWDRHQNKCFKIASMLWSSSISTVRLYIFISSILHHGGTTDGSSSVGTTELLLYLREN